MGWGLGVGMQRVVRDLFALHSLPDLEVSEGDVLGGCVTGVAQPSVRASSVWWNRPKNKNGH